MQTPSIINQVYAFSCLNQVTSTSSDRKRTFITNLIFRVFLFITHSFYVALVSCVENKSVGSI